MSLDLGTWLAIAALIVSAGTLMVSGVAQRDTARRSVVDDLGARMNAMSIELRRVQEHADECDRTLASLKEDQLLLMKKILRNGNGNGKPGRRRAD